MERVTKLSAVASAHQAKADIAVPSDEGELLVIAKQGDWLIFSEGEFKCVLDHDEFCSKWVQI